MDIKQAEDFFKRYRGDSYLMGREDPAGAEAYRAARIDAAQEGAWRAELCESYLAAMMDETAYAWMHHSNCIEVLKGMRARCEELCAKLLDATNWLVTCGVLDGRQRIIMLETMGGRTGSLRDGGICLMAKFPQLRKRLEANVVALADFTCTAADNQDLPGWEDARARYDAAVAACRQAFKWF